MTRKLMTRKTISIYSLMVTMASTLMTTMTVIDHLTSLGRSYPMAIVVDFKMIPVTTVLQVKIHSLTLKLLPLSRTLSSARLSVQPFSGRDSMLRSIQSTRKTVF